MTLSTTKIDSGAVGRPVKWSADTKCLTTVIAAYAIVMGAVMLWSGGLPYVLDGNEVFSNLIHARNWFEFGTGVTHGLADESFGIAPASHPFLHTHQGNMPRLTATFLYTLGIRSPEAQIWIHALTLGTLTVIGAHKFLLRIGGPWLATGACLALVTDYIFFVQWQVNTYRFWMMFFLVMGLLLAEFTTRDNLKRQSILFFVYAAFLFYGEVVFATFCAILIGTYIILRHFKYWSVIVATGTASFLGATTGLGILVLQLVSFYGWKNLLKDFAFTFVTRNETANPQSIPKDVIDFYSENPIAFFFNAQDQQVLQTLDKFIGSIFSFQAAIYHPLIWVLAALVLLFWLTLLVAQERAFQRWAAQRPELAPRTCIIIWVISVCYLAFEFLFNGTLAPYLAAPKLGTMNPVGLAFFIALGVLCLYYVRERPMALLFAQRGVVQRLLLSACFGFAAAVLVRGSQGLFGAELIGFWHYEMGNLSRAVLGLTGWVIVVALMIALLLPRSGDLLPPIPAGPLARFAVASVVAYGAVYWVIAGYVFSGYLYRGQSLLPLQWAVFFGLAFAILGHVISRTYRSVMDLHRAPTNAGILRSLRNLYGIVAAGAFLGLTLSVFGWAMHQMRYATRMPPDQFRFVQSVLRQPELRGSTSVTNAYGAPFAYELGNWSYGDNRLGAGRISWDGERWEPELRSLRYLWFADRHTNKAYLRPDLFICFSPINLLAESLRYRGRNIRDCYDMPLVKQALSGKASGVTLIASDDREPRRWAIVRFHWQKPPE